MRPDEHRFHGRWLRHCTRVAVVVAMGCAGDKASESMRVSAYLEAYPEAFCSLWAECNPDKLRDLYDGDLTVCVDDIGDGLAERLDRDGCGYDGRAAADCIDGLSAMECVDWEEGEGNVCGDVIDCSSVVPAR